MKKLLFIFLFVPALVSGQLYPVVGYSQSGAINVRGDATIYVVPDKILIHFGVETKDKDLVTSRMNNKAITDKALAKIKELGVKESDIQTDFLNVEPRYRWEGGKEVFLGYYSRNGLVVTVKNKEILESVIASSLESGVNYIHGIDFQTTKLRKYRDDARKLAIRAAKEKAENFARELGVKAGPPLSINETQIHNWYYYYSGWQHRRNEGYMTQNVVQNVPQESPETDGINLGKIAIKASVSVSFQIIRDKEEDGVNSE